MWTMSAILQPYLRLAAFQFKKHESTWREDGERERGRDEEKKKDEGGNIENCAWEVGL